MASRESYAHDIVTYKTTQEAIEKFAPFRGLDPFRVDPRKTTFSKLIVSTGFVFYDVEIALRKELHEMQTNHGSSVMPVFADQGNCSKFDPDEYEEHFDKLTLVELVANTRVNQALNIHPTTDAIAQRIDEEALKIQNDSKREFLESYDDANSQIRLRRMASGHLVDLLTEPLGTVALTDALLWEPGGFSIREQEKRRATSSVPFGLSREQHPRFATCVDDPIAVSPRKQRMQVLEKVEEVDVEDSEIDNASVENIEMKWEQSHLEEARNYESDAAAGSHDIGFVNTYEAEGLEPPNANPTDQEPHRTCGHGSDYREDCSQCNALCRYRDDKSLALRSQQTIPVKEEYANVEGERKRKRDGSVTFAKPGGSKLSRVKTQGQVAKNFDDIALTRYHQLRCQEYLPLLLRCLRQLRLRQTLLPMMVNLCRGEKLLSSFQWQMVQLRGIVKTIL